jgi:hypothetical protein
VKRSPLRWACLYRTSACKSNAPCFVCSSFLEVVFKVFLKDWCKPLQGMGEANQQPGSRRLKSSLGITYRNPIGFAPIKVILERWSYLLCWKLLKIRLCRKRIDCFRHFDHMTFSLVITAESVIRGAAMKVEGNEFRLHLLHASAFPFVALLDCCVTIRRVCRSVFRAN